MGGVERITTFKKWLFVLFLECGLHIDGLVQDCNNSSALAMELVQFCTKPSICEETTNRNA